MNLPFRFLLISVFFIISSGFLSAQPDWVQSVPFEGSARDNAVSFTLNGKGYVGLGSNDTTLFNDFWRYDPATYVWTKIADFGGAARRNAVAFVLDGKAYVGLGQSGIYPDFTNHKDFWVYDPVADSWTETTEFAGTARYKSVAFTQGDKGFVMLGRDESGYPKDVWAFDPVSKQWTAKNNFSDDGRIGAFVFSLNDTIYVGHGVNYEGGSTNIQNNYHVYDATADSWTEVDVLPSKITIRNDIFYFSLNGKGYFGGGTHDNETWEFDPATNTWTEMDEVGNSQYKISASTAFVIDSVAHIATGYNKYSSDKGKYVNDFFKFGEGLIIPERPDEVAVKIISTTAVEITWRDNSDNEAGFIIEKSKFSPANYKPIGVLGPDETSFVDEDMELYVTYFYRIRAFRDGISGAPYSDQIYFEYPYNAPTQLKAHDNAANGINLTWKDNAHLEEGFIIERSLNDTLNWTVIDSVGVDISEYFDKTISPQTYAYYRVKGFYGVETTEYSNYDQAYMHESGAWLKDSEFPGEARNGYFSFVIGNKLYVGAGRTVSNYEPVKDVWAYDLDAGTWEQLDDFAAGYRWSMVSFSINGKGYVGMGANADSKYKDFWEYNPATDTWTQKNDFAGVANYGATSFVIDNKTYVLTGLDADFNKYKSFYEYDPALDSWTQKADFIGTGRSQGIGVAANGLGYIGFGTSLTTGTVYKDLFAYDPDTDSWEEKTGIEGNFEKWPDAFASVQNGQIIMGTGVQYKEGLGLQTDRLWKYDIATDQWTPWGRFPLITANHTSFTYNGNIYALGIGGKHENMELYQYIANAPATPLNLTAKATLDTAILEWIDQSAKETGFVIERKSMLDSVFKTLATAEANTNGYTDTLPEDGIKYIYRLKAINDDGNSGFIETETNWRPLRSPDSVSVELLSGNSLTVNWANKSENAGEIEVYMSEKDTLSYYENLATRDVDGDYWNGWLKENTTYHFKVRALAKFYSPQYHEAYSPFVYVSGKTLLNTPAGLAVENAAGGIAISWENTSKHETAYEIERSVVDEDNFELIHTTTADDTAFIDTSFEEGIRIYYRVRAINEDNYSAYSEVVDVLTYFAPTNFTATLITSDSIEFSWKNQSDKAPNLYLKRGYAADSLSEYPYTFTATLDSEKEVYTDYLLKENTVYRYFVQAHDYDNYSSPSNILLVHTLLKTPANLAFGHIEEDNVELRWENKTEAEDYTIVIEMAEEGGAFAEIGTLNKGIDKYTVDNLVSGKNYQFRIKIFNEAVGSEYSNVITASPVTGLNERLNLDVKITVSPNPAGSYLKVKSEKQIKKIAILNLSGKTVKLFGVHKEQVYDISSLPSGIYIVSAIVGDEVSIMKFVKQ